jgi:hypothetical protein
VLLGAAFGPPARGGVLIGGVPGGIRGA